jgi:hypothetical protein
VNAGASLARFAREAEPVWLGLKAAAARRLDFLGSWRFGCENPRFRVLDFLGFPWILSSESRLINGLRWIFAEKFFLGAFLAGGVCAETRAPSFGCAKGQTCSSGELSLISDFLQSIVGSTTASAIQVRTLAFLRSRAGFARKAQRWPRRARGHGVENLWTRAEDTLPLNQRPTR